MSFVAIAMFLAVCGALLAGYPVALTLAGVALIFAGGGTLLGVFDPSFMQAVPNRVFGIMMNGTLIAVPLFVLMGVVLERSRVAEQLLTGMASLFGRVPGGLAASVVTLFLHPASRVASTRALCGGHILALFIGSGFALLSVVGPVEGLMLAAPLPSDLGLALVVAMSIFVMAVTDTEHPPAAGTVLAMAPRPWDIKIVAVIIAEILPLAVVRRLIGHRLHDLA